MTTLPLDQFRLYDVALDGIGLITEHAAEAPFALSARDFVIDRQDFSEELTENKLDELWWRSSRSWHMGAGQTRFDVPEVSDRSAFLSSKGVDIRTEGELTLTHEAVKRVTETADPIVMTVADDFLWSTASSGNIRKTTALDGTSSLIATGVAAVLKDLASDGKIVYICFGGTTGGVRRVLAGAGSVTAWSDANADILTWAKGRLYGVGDNGSGRFRLLELDSGAGSTEIFLFPEGQTPVVMAELGPLLYIATRSSTDSFVYAYDGTNAPFVALPLPPGDVVSGLVPFLGAGFLVGAERLVVDAADQGVLYVAFPNGSGHLVLLEREIVIFGEDDTDTGKSYAIQAGVGWSREVWFSWPHDDASGLGVYLPRYATYARHFHAADAATGQVTAAAIWRGKVLFAVAGVGIYVEQGTFNASGLVISSEIDVNVDALKTWVTQETGFDELPAGTEVHHEFSTDRGGTWTGLAKATATDAVLLTSHPDKVSRSIRSRTTLKADAAKALTPTLEKAGFAAALAGKPKPEHTIVIQAYPNARLRGGMATRGPLEGANLLVALLGRWRADGVYDFQPSWWRSSADTLRVRIADMSTPGPWATSGEEQGGLVVLRLKEVA